MHSMHMWREAASGMCMLACGCCCCKPAHALLASSQPGRAAEERAASAASVGHVQAGYLLAGVLEAHPGMKLVAAREVERFLFRPGLAERARYSAVVFLNQMPLSHSPAHGAPRRPSRTGSAAASAAALGHIRPVSSLCMRC